MKCDECGKEKESLLKFGRFDNVCKECLEKKINEKTICPICSYEIKPGSSEDVTLILTPKGSTEKEKAKAPEVLVTVCPVCRGLFFDEMSFKFIQGLKR